METLKRFFVKDTDKEENVIAAQTVSDKETTFEDDYTEEKSDGAVAGDKSISDYTLKEIAQMKDDFGDDDMLNDILSEEFAVFSQARSGSLAEKYEAFSKLKTLMKPKTENKKEETVYESEGRLHSGFSGGGYRDVSTGLTKRQMDMARSAGMSFKEYEELLVSAPAGRKNRF